MNLLLDISAVFAREGLESLGGFFHLAFFSHQRCHELAKESKHLI
jgi:hypothetical protein